jgi:hypothetical protein
MMTYYLLVEFKLPVAASIYGNSIAYADEYGFVVQFHQVILLVKVACAIVPILQRLSKIDDRFFALRTFQNDDRFRLLINVYRSFIKQPISRLVEQNFFQEWPNYKSH